MPEITNDPYWKVDLSDESDVETRIAMAEQLVAILIGWAFGIDEETPHEPSLNSCWCAKGVE